IPFSNDVPFQPVTSNWNPWVQYGRFGAWRSHVSPMYSIGDDLSLPHGKHAFKCGFALRNTKSQAFGDPGFTTVITIRQGNNLIGGLDSSSIAGLTANNGTQARNLLTDLTGSIDHINQSFGITSSKDTTLKASPYIPYKFYRQHQSEMGAYFKDDWKFRP